MDVFIKVDAHEFGHAFGLKDMYASANDNNGYEPIANDELKYNKNTFGLSEGNGIMMYHTERNKKCQKLLNVKRCLLMKIMLENFMFGTIRCKNFKKIKSREIFYENI